MSLRGSPALAFGGLFQARVVNGPVDLAADLAGAAGQLRQPEVHQLRCLVGRDQNVGRLQVAVRQALAEGMGQAVGGFLEQPKCLGRLPTSCEWRGSREGCRLRRTP